jgi:protein ImuB
VTAANGPAREEGIWPGLGLADARARCPRLVSAPADPEEDARALLSLARWCVRYAPSFNVDGADGLWIDIAGAAHLFGGEAALLRDLENRLEGFGFTARIGLADTAGAAWALARFSASAPAIAPPGGQAGALAPLPVEGLRLDTDAVTLLKRLGLKRIGQLADIPRASLKRRFPSREIMEAVLTRLDQALWKTGEPARPLTPPPRYSARLIFAEPLISNDGFEAALESLARDLCAGLARALAGARTVGFTACRSDGSVAAFRTGFAAPCRQMDHMVRLLGEKAKGIDAGSGIDAMVLAAQRTEPLPAEQSTFATGDRAAPLAPLIDRLSGRLAPEHVCRAVPLESHIPERAQVWRPALYSADSEPPPCPVNPLRPPLLLERPEPIEVLAEVPEGPPVRFTWRRARHRILRWQGPERIAPEWWRLIADTSGEALHGTRDYYRIEDEDGRHYWVFRAGLYQRPEGYAPPRWYLHGVLG